MPVSTKEAYGYEVGRVAMSPRGPRGDTGPADYEQQQTFQKVLKKCAQGSVPSPVPAASLRPAFIRNGQASLETFKEPIFFGHQ